ncbi:hypothetical protein [Sulfitobacter sabulilitoris]|uniref:EF-hand domain-containing protein n=1 Tax=Sulfitobacter sabulilitoris TaxID=2562655 RepID=A0A5S3PKH9_9RHOB|nr:hypothetical protein [Sulfitobacter sabulilitoris]TMM54857.1 hypothetical protein FDT80_04560 [Sulfitobacter sabulilitoris]
MTKLTTFALLLSAAATTAFAMGEGAAEMDTNGDGVLTIDEVQATYPEVTPESFSSMDLNADGALDEEEIAAAQDAGTMPTPTEG